MGNGHPSPFYFSNKLIIKRRFTLHMTKINYAHDVDLIRI